MTCPTMSKTTFCEHRFFFYSFTTSDSSEGTTASHVVSPRSIIVHHGFGNRDVRRARKQNIDYSRQRHTPHCWFLVKVVYPTKEANCFSSLTRSTPIFIVEEHSHTHTYIYHIERAISSASFNTVQEPVGLDRGVGNSLDCITVFPLSRGSALFEIILVKILFSSHQWLRLHLSLDQQLAQLKHTRTISTKGNVIDTLFKQSLLNPLV